MEIIKYDPESQKMLDNMDQASYALSQARSVAEIKHVHDIAEAAKRYAKAADLCNEAYVMASVVAADARRKAGEMLLQLERGEAGRPSENSTARGRVSEYIEVLQEINLPIQTAGRWQQEARVPEAVYQEIKQNALDNGKEISQREVLKVVKEVQKEQIRKDLANEGSKKKIDIDLRFGDFMEVFLDLPDGSIDCIITDPPYPYDYINEWSKLAKFAKRVLKPNGYCIAYSGQMYLPEVMKRLSEHLDYYWTFAVYHEGQTQIVMGVNLTCRWKPVLIFQNGKKKLPNTFQDYFISEAREKDGHDWQQSQSGVAYLVEMFTKQNDKVLDPFAGSGTTLIVAKNKARIALGAEVDEQTYNIAKALL